jgi:hypothetical protein
MLQRAFVPVLNTFAGFVLVIGYTTPSAGSAAAIRSDQVRFESSREGVVVTRFIAQAHLPGGSQVIPPGGSQLPPSATQTLPGAIQTLPGAPSTIPGAASPQAGPPATSPAPVTQPPSFNATPSQGAIRGLTLPSSREGGSSP